LTNPCGLVPVEAAITVATDGAVLSTTTVALSGAFDQPAASVAVTE
jgi:hypothetical protein